MSEEINDVQEPQMSVEEMKQRRDEITAYYKEEIPHLQVKADYEELITRIEKAKNERILGQLQMAQIMAPPPEMQEQMGNQFPPEGSEDFNTKTEKTSKSKGKRTLKKA